MYVFTFIITYTFVVENYKTVIWPESFRILSRIGMIFCCIEMIFCYRDDILLYRDDILLYRDEILLYRDESITVLVLFLHK